MKGMLILQYTVSSLVAMIYVVDVKEKSKFDLYCTRGKSRDVLGGSRSIRFACSDPESASQEHLFALVST